MQQLVSCIKHEPTSLLSRDLKLKEIIICCEIYCLGLPPKSLMIDDYVSVLDHIQYFQLYTFIYRGTLDLLFSVISIFEDKMILVKKGICSFPKAAATEFKFSRCNFRRCRFNLENLSILAQESNM